MTTATPKEIWRVVDIARHRRVTTAQIYKSLKTHPLPPDYMAGTVPLWNPENVKAWSQTLPERGKYQRNA